LEKYYTLLTSWNAKFNLTSLRLAECSDEAIDRLIIEPLQAASIVDEGLLTWWDIGSGGGSPALPLKIRRTSARLTMVESRSRKVAFLREAVRQLGLADVDVLHDRLEHAVEGSGAQGSVDLVTVRAVRPDAALLGHCGRLLRRGGRLLLFRSVGSLLRVPVEFRVGGGRMVLGSGGELAVWERV
jgi:16S rRNA (guanine527-N7)-methyltransferase